MNCLQLRWTVHFRLLCFLSFSFNLVNAAGLCKFEEMFTTRINGPSYGGVASSEPNKETTETLTTEYKLTMTSYPTTTKTKSLERNTTNAESGTKLRYPTTTHSRTITLKETTTEEILITTYDPAISEAQTNEESGITTYGPSTTVAHTIREKTATKQIHRTPNQRTPTEAHTSERITTDEGFRTTTYDPTITEAFTTKQTVTTGEHTTIEIHSSKHTTSPKTTEILSTKVTTTDLITSLPTTLLSCPTNMIYTNCTCQTTCEDPKRLNGCFNSCTGGELCICPNGFYLLEGNCIPPEECGCYVQNEDVIIQEDDTQLFLNCTQQCSCLNGVLSCENYQCDTNALCDNELGTFECHCKDGYHGDGGSCTRLTDCKDVYDSGLIDDGVYKILPTDWTKNAFEVYCKDGWNVFQRRMDGSVDFFLYWADYKEGFGDLRHEMWLGLEKLFYLTKQGFYALKISLIRDNIPYEINHTFFRVSNEADNYRLTELGSYSGNIGTNTMDYHHGFQFSTRDRDNDNHPTVDCAGNSKGAWWHKQCWKITLNGPYGSLDVPGVCYQDNGEAYCNVAFTEMSIKRSHP